MDHILQWGGSLYSLGWVETNFRNIGKTRGGGYYFFKKCTFRGWGD